MDLRILSVATVLALFAACSDMPVTPEAGVSGVPETATDTPGETVTEEPVGEEPTGGASSESYASPLRDARLWVDPNSNAARQAAEWRSSRPEDAAEMDKLAAQAQAVWFGDWNPEPFRWVREVTTRIRGEGALPIYVLYNIPQRDCGLYSAGGANSAAEYSQWIGDITRAIGSEPAAVVLEPDALAGMDCLSASDQRARLEMIHAAVRKLKSTGRIAVYIDAGNPRWHDAAAIAERLRDAGIGDADGFSLNVSNFLTNDENVRYGEAVSSLVGGKHYVIDTSRNGQGPTADLDWCNPEGRGLGTKPTVRTGHPLVDAFLWIKSPGESDGECKGAPTAGVWWADYALKLLRNAPWNS